MKKVSRSSADIGVSDIVVSDFLDPAQLGAAFEGVLKVFQIGPPAHPRELAIGQAMINLARTHGVQQFVYFSVLQPMISSLRHHWNKLLTQEYLIDSGVPYTVLHPTMFMQSPLRAVQSGVMAAPYSTDQLMSTVDLDDVAEVEVKVLTEDTHLRAAHDLVGDQPLSLRQMATIVSAVAGKAIEVQQAPLDTVTSRLPRARRSRRTGRIRWNACFSTIPGMG